MRKFPPVTATDWIHFCWLLIVDPTFQTAPNKRKAYYEYRLARLYNTLCL